MLGHSFLLQYRQQGGGSKGVYASDGGADGVGEASILFTRHNIGRKRAR